MTSQKNSHLERYSRQMIFPPLGEEGQRRLCASRAAVVGCGALGTVSASLLVRAGVGEVKVIDRDYLQESNLHRQILFDEADLASGLPKAEIARRRLALANSGVRVIAAAVDLRPENALAELEGFQVILDGCDNLETRYLLNDVSLRLGIPWIYGGAIMSRGLVMAILPRRTACLRCLLPVPPGPGVLETCETAGVLGPAPAAAASLQAGLALRILVGLTAGPPLGALLRLDVWDGEFSRMETALPDPQCPACSPAGRLAFLEGEGALRPAALCGQRSVQVFPPRAVSLDLQGLAKRLGGQGTVRILSANPHLLRFAEGELELALFPDGRGIVTGTEDPAVARGFYSRFVGG